MLARRAFASRTRRVRTRRLPAPGGRTRKLSLMHARCAICGMRVGRDDALGLIRGRPAHAECALMHWLHN